MSTFNVVVFAGDYAGPEVCLSIVSLFLEGLQVLLRGRNYCSEIWVAPRCRRRSGNSTIGSVAGSVDGSEDKAVVREEEVALPEVLEESSSRPED
jgi:hypothetical protein